MTLPYYPFYWGDYSAKTFNLTQGQHGAYMLLLRYIYVEEHLIPDGSKYVIGGGYDDESRANIDFILAKYFLKKNGKWKNERACEIIIKQQELHQAHVSKGKKGGRPHKPELNLNLSSDKVGPKQPEPEPNIVEELSSARDVSIALEKRLREAAGWENRPEPNLFITGPIQSLIDSGADLEADVLSSIRSLSKRCDSPNWKFFLSAIARARDTRVAALNLKTDPQTIRQPNARPSKNTLHDSFAIVNAAIDDQIRREAEDSGQEHGEDAAGLSRLRQITT